MFRGAMKIGFAIVAGSLLLTACSSTKEEAQAPVTTTNPSSIKPGSAEDFRVNVGDTVLFDLDQHSIRSDAQGILQKQAAWLKQYPSVRLMVEGHCDERGTEEYNRALGERRALALREALMQLGADTSKITTRTYGKDRKIDLGNSEAAHAKNRRGEFVVLRPK